jgi:hypothetical protein
MAGRFQMGRGPSARTRKGAKSHRMSELPAERCETCRFYQGSYALSKHAPVGFCYRKPPVLVSVQMTFATAAEWHRPNVAASDPACGEFKPSQAPSA